MQKQISLFGLEQVALIIEGETGVYYRNQVGGVVCWEAEQEGTLCPLELDPGSVARLESAPYPSGRIGITSQNADLIDELLALSSTTSWLKVDRARLDESWEAWVYLTVAPLASSPIRGFGEGRGVLTWPSSD